MNLQIRKDSAEAINFYKAVGYKPDAAVSFCLNLESTYLVEHKINDINNLKAKHYWVGIKIKRMKIGEIVDNFKVPPHPSNIILEGNLVRLEPLKADKHSVHLFESNAIDKE